MATASEARDGAPVLVVDQFEELFTHGSRDGPSSTRRAAGCRRASSRRGRDHRRTQRPSRRAQHQCRRCAGSPSMVCTCSARWPATTCGRRSSNRPRWRGCGSSRDSSSCWFATARARREACRCCPTRWPKRGAGGTGNTLTVDGYREQGRHRGAVARSADRLYDGLSADERASLRAVLLRLVSPTLDGEPVRCRVPSRALLGDPDRDRVIALIVQSRSGHRPGRDVRDRPRGPRPGLAATAVLARRGRQPGNGSSVISSSPPTGGTSSDAPTASSTAEPGWSRHSNGRLPPSRR